MLNRFQDVCRNLSQWLEVSDDTLLRERYGKLARERIQEEVPLREVVLAAQIFERVLSGRLRKLAPRDEAPPGDDPENDSENDSEAVIREFFNHVVFNLVSAYEEAVLRALA